MNNTIQQTIKHLDKEHIITIKQLIELELIKRKMVNKHIKEYNDQVGLFDYNIDELRD
tara:strand:+ start:1903 stop:2076 length:174 start_codon:yes stop_codon:yes gene_type:complete